MTRQETNRMIRRQIDQLRERVLNITETTEDALRNRNVLIRKIKVLEGRLSENKYQQNQLRPCRDTVSVYGVRGQKILTL